MKRFLLGFSFLFISLSVFTQITVSTITEPFNGSGGLTIGPDGMLYVADFGASLDNGRGTQVWRMDFQNGEDLELFAEGFNGASGNDFDSEGNLFQSNIAIGVVSKVTPAGVVSTFASGGISCNVGINIDDEDNLYVCNCCGNFGNTIRKVSPQGGTSEFAASSLLFCPNGITRDNEDNLYVSNFSNGNVLKITPTGQVSRLATTPGTQGIAGPSNGHIIYSKEEDVLYVASHGASRIYKLTLDGQLSVLAGSGVRGNEDGPALTASFSRPNGLALSSTEDTLFVNSSIPTTDAGGRPLNPSVIRMITGIRNITSVERPSSIDVLDLIHWSELRTIEVLSRGQLNDRLQLRLVSISGQSILSQELDSRTSSVQVSLPSHIPPGIYVVHVNNGMHSLSKKISVQ